MIKIALVDDHTLLRKSLVQLLEKLEGVSVILEAANGKECIEQLQPGRLPDILLLDITMPIMDGVETARWLKQHYPSIKVLALSMIKNDLVIIRMLKNGARGYLLKDCEPCELEQALQLVQEKGFYYNELVTPKLRWRSDTVQDTTGIMINERELVFLQYTCTEKSYKEIAAEMNVSPRTVDGYRDALFQKLQVSTRVGLAIYAIKNGFVVF